MAKSLEVAVDFLRKSIERGKEEPKYYMDFVKLHKLMYLGQCFINYHYGINLFEETIMAMDDGPRIDGIELVVGKCGFGEIKNIEDLERYLPFALSMLRQETVDYILNTYGQYSTDEMVKVVKNTKGWKLSYNDKSPNEIEYKLINETGKELFEGVFITEYGTKHNYIYSCEHLCKIGGCPKSKKKTLL